MNKTNHIILAIVLCFSLVFVAFPLKGFSYYLGNGNGAVDVGEPGGTEGPFEGDGYEYYTGYVPPPPPIDGVTAPGGWIVTEVSPIEEESTTARIEKDDDDDDDNGSSPPPSSGGGCTEDPPPVTSPPATSPPVTSPPATSPPVTSPPVTSPPATSPPPTSPPPTSPPPTLPAIEPCMIHYFEVPSRAWVDYPITGKWSASASCDDCDVDCTPYSECAWKQDSIGTGFDEYKFTLSQSGTYDYTLTCYGEGGIDERTESATVEALNLPWWQEIIPVLQGFLRGVWG